MTFSPLRIAFLHSAGRVPKSSMCPVKQRASAAWVSGSPEQTAAIRSATLVNDPEFHALSEENFVVATLPATNKDGTQADASLDLLLGGRLEPDAVEVIVTDDGETPVFMASGSQSPERIVSGLRRFLVARQTARRAGATRR
jgi:hypothetical protein